MPLPRRVQACLPLLLLALAPSLALARGTISKIEIDGLEKDPAIEQNVRLSLGLNDVLGKEQGESRLELLLLNAERDARRALEPFGYYSPSIEVDSVRDEQDRITVTLRIDKGQPVQVRDFRVDIAGPGGEDHYLQEDLAGFRPRPGERFDHALYEEHKDGITRRLAERGYFDADFLTREVRVSRAEAAADVDLVWDSGFRYDMGPTTFHQDYFRPGLLEKLVTWEEGSYYHEGKLDRLRESLVRLDYFSAIDIQPKPEEASDDLRVPVDVNLVMAKRNIYTAGLSYGTESGTGVRLGVERRYVNDRGHKLNWDLDWAQKRKSFLTQYRVPAFAWLDGWYGFSIGFYDEQTDYIDLRNVKLVASRSGEISEHWTAVASLNALRERWSYDMDTATGSRLYTYSTLVYPELSATYVDVDDRLFPRRGLSGTLAVRGGVENVGSDTSFIQLHGSGTWYRPFGVADRLIVRGEAGTTWTGELVAMPPSLRFFAGGDRSIRGYAWREVGPRTPPPDNFALGARRVVTASVEYEHYFKGGPWGGAAFVDAGDAFDGDFNPRVGVGIGARWRSPVGPVRIDIAHGLDDPDSSFQIYLSLGANL
ncbi:outer membrane protein assembly factor [Pseudoxanthomonas sp. SGNA-20]|uniref:autotransporter assembly complex protein TamA n=1 Tax=Pseudoxanthomonas sp. SGNA-20 TaxID=2493088 RepID=UPI000F64108A|nr:autotransporter assembly complex family protein [Pseudoxanthomonas sp. SGNA-20]RRN53953.1 outer membrane protein assembly factor [Pseudoxanthomonas sp. SGNA-20]